MTIYRSKYAPVEVNGELAKDPNDYERLGLAHPDPVPLNKDFSDLEDDIPGADAPKENLPVVLNRSSIIVIDIQSKRK